MTQSSEEDQWELVWCHLNHRWYYLHRRFGISSWTRPAGCSLVLPDSPRQPRRRNRCSWACGRCIRRAPNDQPCSADNMDLPDGWQAAWDPQHGGIYFYNRNTMQRCWTKPSKEAFCFDGDGRYAMGGAVSSTAVPESSRASLAPSSGCEEADSRSLNKAQREVCELDLENIQVVVDDRHEAASGIAAQDLKDPCGSNVQESVIVTFQPGPIGFYSKDGHIIEKVADGGQAQRAGVEVGWKILAVGPRSCTSVRDKVFQDAKNGDAPYKVAFAKADQCAFHEQQCRSPEIDEPPLPRQAAEIIGCFLGTTGIGACGHSVDSDQLIAQRQAVENTPCLKTSESTKSIHDAALDGQIVASSNANSPSRSIFSWRTVDSPCQSTLNAQMVAGIRESSFTPTDVATQACPTSLRHVQPSSFDFRRCASEETRGCREHSSMQRSSSPAISESSWQSALESPHKSARGDVTPQQSEVSGPQCSEPSYYTAASYFTSASKEKLDCCEQSWKSVSSKHSSTLELSDFSWSINASEARSAQEASLGRSFPESPSRMRFGVAAEALASVATLLSPSRRKANPDTVTSPEKPSRISIVAATEAFASLANLLSPSRRKANSVDASPGSPESPAKPTKGKGKGKAKGTPPPHPKAGGPTADGSPSKGKQKGKGGGKGRSPRKPDIVPKVALKKIFWNPICLDESHQTNADAELSVWEKIHQNGVSIDEGELEVLFADVPRAADGTIVLPTESAQPRRRLSSASVNSRRLLPETRRRQIWCMLSLLPEWDQLQEAISSMDDSVVSNENVDLLWTNLPTAAEEKLLQTALMDRSLKHDETWDAPEDFLIRLTSIPANALHISIWNFLNSFNANFLRLQQAKDDLVNACTALRDSARVEKLLAVILYTGNYLNGGTSRGRADGFDIDCLLKVSKLKAVQKELNGTLLDFVVKQVEQEVPGMLSGMFASGMEKDQVHCARKHMLVELTDEVVRLRAQAESHLIKWGNEEEISEALAKRKADLDECIERLRSLSEGFVELQSQYSKLCTWFQMKVEKPRATDEFFSIWNTFFEDVGRCLDSLQKRQKSVLPIPRNRSNTPPQRLLVADSLNACNSSRRSLASPREALPLGASRRSRGPPREPLQQARRRPMTPRDIIEQVPNFCLDGADTGQESAPALEPSIEQVPSFCLDGADTGQESAPALEPSIEEVPSFCLDGADTSKESAPALEPSIEQVPSFFLDGADTSQESAPALEP